MKTKFIKIIKELPLEVGKTYVTKTQVPENFRITKIDADPKKDGEQIRIYGVYERYENRPDMHNCPLPPDRLIHETVEDGQKEVCAHCGK